MCEHCVEIVGCTCTADSCGSIDVWRTAQLSSMPGTLLLAIECANCKHHIRSPSRRTTKSSRPISPSPVRRPLVPAPAVVPMWWGWASSYLPDGKRITHEQQDIYPTGLSGDPVVHGASVAAAEVFLDPERMSLGGTEIILHESRLLFPPSLAKIEGVIGNNLHISSCVKCVVFVNILNNNVVAHRDGIQAALINFRKKGGPVGKSGWAFTERMTLAAATAWQIPHDAAQVLLHHLSEIQMTSPAGF